MSTWVFSLDHGGDISPLVETSSIKRTMRLHSDLKPNVNKLQFSLRFDADLFGALLSYDTISITVTKDAAPFFSGCLSPNYKTSIRDGHKSISITAEDATLQTLGKTIGEPWAKAGYAVSTPAATATSLVHAIAAEAGVTLAEGVPTIDTVVPYLVIMPDDKKTWAKLLEQILFEYGYVYAFNADGTLGIHQLVNPGAVASTATLTTEPGIANIRGELEIEKSPEKYDDIRVLYNLVELKTGIVVFKDADEITMEAAGNVEGKDYYPLTSKSGEVYSNWKSPDGHDIWVVSSGALSATPEAGITLMRPFANFYKKATFAYQNTVAGKRKITGLKITGNAYVISSKNTARSSETSGKQLLEYQASYLFSDSMAQQLARNLGQYYAYSDIIYGVRSTAALAVGQYVTVADPVYSGVTSACRVVGIVEGAGPTVVYEYDLEAVADFTAIAIVTEGEHGSTAAAATVLEQRYQRAASQPAAPTADDPEDWYLAIPNVDLPCWMTQAYKYPSGLLVNAWSIPQRIVTVEDTEAIRGGDLIDGAIDRAKLESGLMDEFGQMQTELFPAGIGQQSTIELITPRVGIAEDVIDNLYGLIGEQEELVEVRAKEILLVASQADADRTRIASVEIGLDSIVQTVAELIPLQEGQVLNLTQITQNAQAIELMATEGTYDPGTGAVDTKSLAEAKLVKDRFDVFIGGTGDDHDAATWVVKQDEIAARVQAVVEDDAGVRTAITEIVQTDESIAMQVSDLRSTTLEDVDAALVEAQAGILVTSQMVAVEAQARGALGEELSGKIVVEADRITSEVSRATESEGTLASQIVQTAESINLSVFGTEAAPGPLPAVQSQLAITKNSIAAQVEGSGATALLAMSVTLPSQINEATYQRMINAIVRGVPVGSTKVLAVYTLQPDGTYAIKSAVLTDDYKALKTALRDSGLLGSQITLDADEILLGGQVKAANIDVGDLNSKGTVIVGQSQVTGLGDALSGKEAAGAATAAQDELAKKLGYASWADLAAKALLGQTVISGGYINTDLIEVDAIKALVGLFNDITVTGEFDGIVKTSDLRSDAVSAGSSNMLVWVLKYSSVKAAVNAPVIILQVDIPFSGSVRTSIDLSVAGGYGAASYYINDVSQGYVSTTSGSMTTLTKDINTNVGDILTVKISNVNGQYTYAQNFKITVNSNIGLLAYLIRVFETGLSSSGASR